MNTQTQATELATNFAILSTEAKSALFRAICKTDICAVDIARITKNLPESIRQEMISLIGRTLDRDENNQKLQLRMIATTQGLPADSYESLNSLTRESTITLINSSNFAVSELWSLSNNGVSFDVINQIVSREVESIVEKQSDEEIKAYFDSMDADTIFTSGEDDLLIIVSPWEGV